MHDIRATCNRNVADAFRYPLAETEAISSVEGGIVALTAAAEFVTLRITRAASCLLRRSSPLLKEVNVQ